MLSINNVSVILKGQQIISDVSFEVMEGQWLMVCGPNGAGKSTLVGTVSGRHSYQGEIFFNGKKLKSMSPKQKAQSIGILEQQYSLDFDYSVEEVVELGRYPYMKGIFKNIVNKDKKIIEEVLELTGLQDKRNQSVLTLSGGELQRAFLAQILIQQPDLLILDEPGNHLDLIYEKELFNSLEKWLSQPGKAIISVMHDLSLARALGSHVLLMNHGQVDSYGPVGKVLTTETLKPIYKIDVPGYLRSKHQVWD